MKLSPSQLRAALDSLAAAHRRAQIARDKIFEHCEVVYGVCPGDVDNDEFIDAVDGGAGAASGMSVAAFDSSMRECMAHMGISMPDNVLRSSLLNHVPRASPWPSETV